MDEAKKRITTTRSAPVYELRLSAEPTNLASRFKTALLGHSGNPHVRSEVHAVVTSIQALSLPPKSEQHCDPMNSRGYERTSKGGGGGGSLRTTPRPGCPNGVARTRFVSRSCYGGAVTDNAVWSIPSASGELLEAAEGALTLLCSAAAAQAPTPSPPPRPRRPRAR